MSDPALAAERTGSKGSRKCPREEEKNISGKEPQKMTQRPRKSFSVGVEPVEKPVIANQSAFLVWQSPNFSGPKLIGSTLKLGDSNASVRYFLGMTLTFLTH